MTSHVRPPPTIGASWKRKERESYESAQAQVAIKSEPSQLVQPFEGSSNRLLAGYLAREFLARGTLLGKQWELGRPGLAGSINLNPNQNLVRSMAADGPGPVEPGQSYAYVSHLLMRGKGAHVPGVVNPTQLARWLQM